MSASANTASNEGRELSGAIADEESEPRGIFAEVHDEVAGLDRVIQQIRATIYGLQQLRPLNSPDLHRAVVDVVSEMINPADEAVELEFAGDPAAGGVTVEIVDDVTAVVREVLAHLHPIAGSALRISVRAATRELTLEIRTPGAIDLPPDVASRLRVSAQRHGGTLVLTSGESEGAFLRWSVPNS